ncbi:MAG TPA: hypothetical protein VMR52_06025 [Dehalococcoidia bacterium]|nr:hypothetical protein [Dehalococcoidia bacterium]
MLYKTDRYVLILPALLALIAIAVLAACGSGDDDEGSGATVIVVSRTPTSPTPAPRRTPTPSPPPTPTPLQVCAPNPDPAPASALQVQEPLPEAQYGLPVHVRGWGSNIGLEDRGVFVAVVDERQSILQINVVPPQPREFRVAPGGLEVTDFTRPFAIDIVIPDPESPSPYCIWVYQAVNDAGRAQGVVQVPIIIVPR